MTITHTKENLVQLALEHMLECKGFGKQYNKADFVAGWEKDDKGQEILVIRLLPIKERLRATD